MITAFGTVYHIWDDLLLESPLRRGRFLVRQAVVGCLIGMSPTYWHQGGSREIALRSQARSELVERMAPQYRAASRSQKMRLLATFAALSAHMPGGSSIIPSHQGREAHMRVPFTMNRRSSKPSTRYGAPALATSHICS